MTNQYLFLSPHLDDVVLSCGATVYSLNRFGASTLITTAFSGKAPLPLSDAAKWFHRICGLGDDAVAVRRLEDAAAARHLNANILQLDLYECLYRKDADGTPRYTEIRQIFSPDVEMERDTLQEVVNALDHHIDFENFTRIHVPLGLGNHVDHLLVRKAVESIAARSSLNIAAKLFYYEELPYAAQSQVGEQRKAQSALTADMHSTLSFIDDDAWQTKLKAVRCYASQIELLWPDDNEMARDLERYALLVGGHSRAERFWSTIKTKA